LRQRRPDQQKNENDRQVRSERDGDQADARWNGREEMGSEFSIFLARSSHPLALSSATLRARARPMDGMCPPKPIAILRSCNMKARRLNGERSGMGAGSSAPCQPDDRLYNTDQLLRRWFLFRFAGAGKVCRKSKRDVHATELVGLSVVECFEFWSDHPERTGKSDRPFDHSGSLIPRATSSKPAYST
jgi:hypothetical protein